MKPPSTATRDSPISTTNGTLNSSTKAYARGNGRTVTAFAYIMHEDRPIGIPGNFYMRTCLEGYDTFRFDKNVLVDAYDKCREVCGYER